MELRHLRYFVQVAEELHFGRAAARLGISQPPLSQQIKALEDELQVKLFDRTSRSVTLTSAGTSFLDAARATLDHADRAITIARRAAKGEIGTLAIGFNASAPFVPEIARSIFEFRQAYPEVLLNLADVSGSDQVSALHDQSIDLGFLRSTMKPQLPETISVTQLTKEGLFVAMRPDHRLAACDQLWLRDLGGEPLLVYENERGGGFTLDVIGLIRGAGAEPVVAQKVREVGSLFGLAGAGLGVTILAETICALQSANLTYRRLRDEAAVTSMWLLHLKDAATLPCRNFLRVIQAQDAARPQFEAQPWLLGHGTGGATTI